MISTGDEKGFCGFHSPCRFRMYYFYILRCKDGSLYCGSTNNLENRLKLHNTGQGSAYVRSRGGGEMVYTESFETVGDAMRREIEVKKWPRARKEFLVRSRTDESDQI